jgi:Leucine-rich repeat (LRR) protein
MLTQLTWANQRQCDLSFLHGMRITALNLSGSRIADLSPLRELPLQELMLNESKISDRDAHLLGDSLSTLSIEACDITDVGFAQLSTLPIRHLSLCKCKQITAVGMARLADMTLESLNLGFSGFSDQCASFLGPSIRCIIFTGCDISDQCLKQLRGLGLALTTLSLRGCTRITVAGIAHLFGMPLEELSLSSNSQFLSADLDFISQGLPQTRIYIF